MSSKWNPFEKFTIRLKTYRTSFSKQFASRFSSDPLLKGILILGSGTAISQVVGLVLVPIITRIYPPAIYGTLAVFNSLITLLLVASTLKYELAIPIAEKDDDAEYLVVLCILILSILTVILFGILTFWGTYLAGIFNFEFLEPYYWLFCIAFFGASLYQMLTYWALRSKLYVQITKTKISQSISGQVSKIIFGILSFGSFGLIIGDIIGRWVGIGTLGKKILPKIWRSIHDIDVHRLRSLASTYRKFPTYSLPSAFINVLALQIPVLFLSNIYGFQIAGLYSLSISITLSPVLFISTSISQAYTAECSDLFRQKSDALLPLYQKTTKKLFKYGAPLILTGAVISPFVFPVIFGSAWKDAGFFVLPLSIYVIAQFVVSSTDRLDMYGYNHWALVWNISRTLLVIGGFYFALVYNLTPIVTILIFSLIMTIMYVICYMLNIKAIKAVLRT